MTPLPSSRVYGTVLAFVRILTGIMWLSHGIPKFTKSAGFMPPDGAIVMYVANGLRVTTGPYHAFLANTVQPNIGLFAELVRLGEVCTGIALTLGLLTRLGGLVGAVLTIDYIAARGNYLSSSALQSLDFGLLVLSLISLLLPTGRVLGIDALFVRRRPPAAPVRAQFVPEPPIRAEFVPEPPLEGPTAPPD
jgi:uncharacterized membrane protein YphA (DoxX/SURF4 family)